MLMDFETSKELNTDHNLGIQQKYNNGT